MPAAELKRKLDEATKDHRILEHPFYKAWAAGTLTLEDLSHYSAQYWRQVEAFPGYLESLGARLPEGSAKEIVAENLRDEVEGDHLGLWLDFANGVGASTEQVRATPGAAHTVECVETFSNGMKTASLPFALGMLYAYESQTPGVAQTKISGLREHYGVDGKPLEYFELHGELDVEHSDDLARALETVLTDEASVEEAEAGARAGAEAVWGLLTGIAEARGIDCLN
ncbi:MAG: iron-containing redox enzyme family protein [Actinomycetota bacterium]